MSKAEGGFHIVATYREIAEHFGLKGPDQGRIKARRAGWAAEPRNHPADPVRVRVPHEVWTGAVQARERGFRADAIGGGSLSGRKGPFRPIKNAPFASLKSPSSSSSWRPSMRPCVSSSSGRRRGPRRPRRRWSGCRGSSRPGPAAGGWRGRYAAFCPGGRRRGLRSDRAPRQRRHTGYPQPSGDFSRRIRGLW